MDASWRVPAVRFSSERHQVSALACFKRLALLGISDLR